MTGVVMITKGCGGEGGGKRRKRNDDQNQFSIVALMVDALRRSMISCRVDRRDEVASAVRNMEIGWPTNVCHVAHVTFDRFNGFLGLPVEFEREIPRKVPSASENHGKLRKQAEESTTQILEVCHDYMKRTIKFTVSAMQNASVFGVSAESMQCSYDSKGNSVPTILLLMQERLYSQGGLKAEGIFRINAENGQEEHVRDQLNKGIVPEDIDVHCLAGLIKAWFRELPAGVLDGLSPEQVLQCNTEEESVELVKLLLPTQAALLNWAVDLMADVVEEEEANKMNARNIAMVFAPNMTQMADPLTALMHAVQVMNLLKTLILKTLREREEIATGGNSPFSSTSSDQQPDEDDFDSQEEVDIGCDSIEDTADENDAEYSHASEDESYSLNNEIEEFFLRQLEEKEEDTNDDQKKVDESLKAQNISPRSCISDQARQASNSDLNSGTSLSTSINKNNCSSMSDTEDSGESVSMGDMDDKKTKSPSKRCQNDIVVESLHEPSPHLPTGLAN